MDNKEIIDDLIKKFETLNVDMLSDEELKLRMEEAIEIMNGIPDKVDMTNSVVHSDRVNIIGYQKTQKLLDIVQNVFMPLVVKVEIARARAVVEFGGLYAQELAKVQQANGEAPSTSGVEKAAP